jgi:hypothetical protein
MALRVAIEGGECDFFLYPLHFFTVDIIAGTTNSDQSSWKYPVGENAAVRRHQHVEIVRK